MNEVSNPVFFQLSTASTLRVQRYSAGSLLSKTARSRGPFLSSMLIFGGCIQPNRIHGKVYLPTFFTIRINHSWYSCR